MFYLDWLYPKVGGGVRSYKELDESKEMRIKFFYKC